MPCQPNQFIGYHYSINLIVAKKETNPNAQFIMGDFFVTEGNKGERQTGANSFASH